MDKYVKSLNTLHALHISIGYDFIKIKRQLIDNINNLCKEVICLKYVEVKYNFKNETVIIKYYKNDKLYSDSILSFKELKNELEKKLGYNNALLLCSIFHTEQENGATLQDIIGYADFANHAIMTFEEFNNGIKYLLQINLVNVINKKIFVNKSFKEWHYNKYNDKERYFIVKEIENVIKYLNKVEKTIILNNYNETEIKEEDFNKSIEKYLKKYSKK